MKNISIIIFSLFIIQLSYGQKKTEDYLKAHSFILMGNNDSSIFYFNKVLKDNPSDYDAIFFRGMANYNMRKYPDAATDFRTVNNRYKGKASLMLAKTELQLNHMEIAINYLREHLESSYKIPEKELLLDPDLNQLEGTIYWNNLWKEKEWYLPYEQEIQEARYLTNSGDYLEALNILQKLEKQSSKRSVIYQNKGEIYNLTGNKKLAIEELTKSVKSDYRNVDALKLRASLYEETGNFQEALDDCKNILRLEPSSFEYYILSAELRSELDDYEGALEEIGTYIRLFPQADTGYYEQGIIHFKHGKYLNAITSFNRALELNTGKAIYYYTRGKSYAATGTYKYAERDFSMSLDLDPLSAETWFAKGQADLKLGMKDDACHAFRKAAQYGIFEARAYVEEICD